MEVLYAKLARIVRRRRRQKGYTKLVYDEKIALYSDNEPYTQHNAISYGHNNNADYDRIKPFTENNGIYSIEDIAKEVVQLLWQAEENDDALQCRISDAVGDRRWSRKMVEACLDKVIECVEQGRFEMGDAMCGALDTATDIADDEFTFPRRHPQSLGGFIAIVSVGVLAKLQGAWVLEPLGFGEIRRRKEVEGIGGIAIRRSDKIIFLKKPRSISFAAWWAREYEAYIPSGALYSYLRRMGMV